ncbi:glycosyltransferase family 2 protein [Halorussus halophilus]|uniref:glycosyltransferase family 2 protein n=1 Tax=Halorussus halophilus TaxID=2650975 RepID=UPI0013019087|nr:glycosyltransferase family A protein [Halorussus halophilus]
MTKVSVVIPCYNDSEYVTDAIESVLEQTRVPEEIFIVDDGSTDDVETAVAEYVKNGDVELLEHETNRGLPAARNTGIRASTEEFIALLDADDKWMPEKTATQVAAMCDRPSVGMVFSDHYRVTPNGDDVISVRRADDPPAQFLENAFVGGVGGILPSTVLIRRECFEQVGYFDEKLRLAQELDMWMRIGAEYPIHRVPRPLVRRRVRNDSLASNKLKKLEYREEFITPKLIEMYPRLQPLVERRKAHLKYLRGSYYASTGDSSKARKQLLGAIRLTPTKWKVYVRLLTTLFGERGMKFFFGFLKETKFRAKNLKRRVEKRMS